MITIWKFTLTPSGFHTLSLPKGSRFLTVQLQRDVPCLWAAVNPSHPLEDRIIETWGTGEQMPDAQRDYLGTFQYPEVGLVFHVFERYALEAK